MATSEWLRFFEDAGIPPGPALGYAVAFVDNRIHKNMLLDLTKELMKELGITVVGDIIAILRHAKVVHRQEMCRAASQSLQPEAGSERGAGGSRRDPPDHREHREHRDPGGAAGRMITKSLSRDPARSGARSAPGTGGTGIGSTGIGGTGISVTVANGAAKAGPDSLSLPSKRRRVTAEMEGKSLCPCPCVPVPVSLSPFLSPFLSPILSLSPPGPDSLSLPSKRRRVTAEMEGKSLCPCPCVPVPVSLFHVPILSLSPPGPDSLSLPSKRRRVTAEMEGKYVISLPKGTTARSRKILQLQAARGLGRTSVFERLGAEAKAAAAAAGKPSGVFSRLGDALDGADPGDAGDAEALPYAGVLKKRRECSGSGAAPCAEAQDGAVSSSVSAEFRPAWGCGKVSSSCELRGGSGETRGASGETRGASGEIRGAGSVFRRLGRKPD
ncbi:uncharacterized protein C19orf47 homolog isoform X2 [Catharus ustulatus]|uniref:uncharacterized protein C19orf47 homolog isoform X1 n=1 Tax=Catharus ustulatus TaxID=91951 RepID=UPI00140B0404|nr:uncharacterized protein C19orf47 homolog isoform X1 [Catharus ustulatus]XP_032942869.1 uncharacterized protein C19orf47 homolog isoform X1 [Catharus ustulatus]XP_032942870.1 uncharacterized protein C19orf47 homolog isoform X2 [Catharus ustulatus]